MFLCGSVIGGEKNVFEDMEILCLLSMFIYLKIQLFPTSYQAVI